jgi:hypothetical protein
VRLSGGVSYRAEERLPSDFCTYNSPFVSGLRIENIGLLP